MASATLDPSESVSSPLIRTTGDGRCFCVRAEMVDKLDSVHDRHPHIGKDHVGPPGFDRFQRRAAIPRLRHLVARILQDHADHNP
jgi:hypothetical protein